MVLMLQFQIVLDFEGRLPRPPGQADIEVGFDAIQDRLRIGDQVIELDEQTLLFPGPEFGREHVGRPQEQ